MVTIRWLREQIRQGKTIAAQKAAGNPCRWLEV